MNFARAVVFASAVTGFGLGATGGSWKQVSLVPFVGQSLSVGGASTPTTGASASNYELATSITTTWGWYWYQGEPVTGGQYVFPPTQNGYVYEITNAGSGTTSNTAPTWPLSVNATVTDGNGVVYKNIQAQVAPFYFSSPTSPSAATYSFAALSAPTKPVQQTGQVNACPTNVLGESTGIAALDQLSTLTGAHFAILDEGVGGSAMADDGPGGATNSWTQLEAEMHVAADLAAAAHESYDVPFWVLTNGEADYFTFTFDSAVASYKSSLNTLVAGVTGQTYNPVALASQQNSTPPGNSGFPFSALAQVYLSRQGVYTLTHPKWQYAPVANIGTQHLTAAGYRESGEKTGEAESVIHSGGHWQALYPTSTSVSGSVVSVNFAPQVGPIHFVTGIGSPHQSGALSGPLANGEGFEVIQVIASVTAAMNASPVAITTKQAHGLTTGNVVNLVNIGGNPAANSFTNSANASVTVTGANTFTVPYTGNGAYSFGGQVRLAVTAATNASPIAITTGTAHGLLTGAVVGQDGILGNTAADGVFVITKTGATTYTLNGTTGNGAYTAGGGVYVYLPIASAAISGNTVNLTMSAAPSGCFWVGAALTPDNQMNYYATAPTGRCANLADSDPFVGSLTSAAQPNYVPTFFDPVPSIAGAP